MIQYTEKGAGLHRAIREAGHSLMQLDGEWVASDSAEVQAIIDAYTLDQFKVERCAAVSAHARRLRNIVTSSIAAGEMASWPIKRAEAEQYNQIGDAASCPSLRLESAARGVEIDALVAKVLANAARFIAAEAAIGGTDGKHRDAIAALETFEAIAVYDFSAGWPEV